MRKIALGLSTLSAVLWRVSSLFEQTLLCCQGRHELDYQKRHQACSPPNNFFQILKRVTTAQGLAITVVDCQASGHDDATLTLTGSYEALVECLKQIAQYTPNATWRSLQLTSRPGCLELQLTLSLP